MQSRLIEFARSYWSEYLVKIERATAGLGDDDLWWRANENSNSIGNLILHLEGNLSHWVLAGLLGEPFERRRSAEFAARGGAGRDELVGRLARVVERCRAGVLGLDADRLGRRFRIQTYDVDGYDALFHAVEHMSYHAGQIVLLAKARLPDDVELEFYPQHRGE